MPQNQADEMYLNETRFNEILQLLEHFPGSWKNYMVATIYLKILHFPSIYIRTKEKVKAW